MAKKRKAKKKSAKKQTPKKQMEVLKAMTGQEFYRVKDMASILGLTEQTVRLMVAKKLIPYHRIGMGRGVIRFRRQDIEAYLSQCAVLTSSE